MKRALSFAASAIIGANCLFGLTNCTCIHDYNKECTATCIKDGENIYTCKKCGETKSEYQKALGHNYSEEGYCSRCGSFKFNINCSTNLPAEFSDIGVFTGSTRTKVELTSVRFSLYSSYLSVKFYGSKTYDIDGEYGTNLICFMAILRDNDGKILKTRQEFGSSLIVGQQIGDGGYLEDNYFIGLENLSNNKQYSLEIRDNK